MFCVQVSRSGVRLNGGCFLHRCQQRCGQTRAARKLRRLDEELPARAPGVSRSLAHVSQYTGYGPVERLLLNETLQAWSLGSVNGMPHQQARCGNLVYLEIRNDYC